VANLLFSAIVQNMVSLTGQYEPPALCGSMYFTELTTKSFDTDIREAADAESIG